MGVSWTMATSHSAYPGSPSWCEACNQYNMFSNFLFHFAAVTLWYVYSIQWFITATPHSYIMHYEAWSILLAALHLVHTNQIGPCTWLWDGHGEPQLVTQRHDTSVVSCSNVQVELRLSTLFMHCTPMWYCRVCISLNTMVQHCSMLLMT